MTEIENELNKLGYTSVPSILSNNRYIASCNCADYNSKQRITLNDYINRTSTIEYESGYWKLKISRNNKKITIPSGIIFGGNIHNSNRTRRFSPTEVFTDLRVDAKCALDIILDDTYMSSSSSMYTAVLLLNGIKQEVITYESNIIIHTHRLPFMLTDFGLRLYLPGDDPIESNKSSITEFIGALKRGYNGSSIYYRGWGKDNFIREIDNYTNIKIA